MSQTHETAIFLYCCDLVAQPFSWTEHWRIGLISAIKRPFTLYNAIYQSALIVTVEKIEIFTIYGSRG